jgi:hypothetical protein
MFLNTKISAFIPVQLLSLHTTVCLSRRHQHYCIALLQRSAQYDGNSRGSETLNRRRDSRFHYQFTRSACCNGSVLYAHPTLSGYSRN